MIHFGWTLKTFGDAARVPPLKTPSPDFVGRFARILRLDTDRLVWMDQVHGNTVRMVNRLPKSGVLDACDACMTLLPNTALCVRMADCLPVVLFDRGGAAVCAIHAGWRGLLAGVVLKALKTFCREVCCSPEQVLASMGPSIERDCYEVGDDMASQFETALGQGVRKFFRRGEKSMTLSLMGMAIWQLETAGVPVPQIQPLEDCTACRPDELYSHRSRQETGRNVMFIYKNDLKPRTDPVRHILN